MKTQKMKIFYQRTTLQLKWQNFLQSNHKPQKLFIETPLGLNATGGKIIRGVYRNEFDKNVEGIFTATIKEFQMPPVVMLIVYNTVFFTAPEGELVNWIPVLNYSLSTVRFSNRYIDNYYREQG